MARQAAGGADEARRPHDANLSLASLLLSPHSRAPPPPRRRAVNGMSGEGRPTAQSREFEFDAVPGTIDAVSAAWPPRDEDGPRSLRGPSRRPAACDDDVVAVVEGAVVGGGRRSYRPPGRSDHRLVGGAPYRPPCPVRYGTSTDAWCPADDDVPATSAPRADDEAAGTFLYVEGAIVPDDVVRLIVDPSVVVIPPAACEGRKKLAEIRFPEGQLREIQYRAFANCTALSGPLRIPSSVKILHECAFEYCTSLTEVVLQDGLEEIRNFAFRGCTSLRQVRNWGTKTRIMLREIVAPTDDERQNMGLVHPDAMLHRNHEYEIGSETTLRPVFNSFAAKRGASLRSLRLTYKGRTMFLSDFKNKTPKQLGMSSQMTSQDGIDRVWREDEVIFVVIEPEEANAGGGRDDAAAVQRRKTQSAKAKKKKSRAARNGSKAKKGQIRQDKPTMSVEDYKRCHSMILTRLHEEAEPRLKDIRTKLNALDLERQPPKSKSMGGRKCAKEEPAYPDASPESGVGGKAGRHHFVVQVGEVQNLYKTTKPSSAHAPSHQNQSGVPTLDLHGCTREEAIARLNESLEVWVDKAMTGYDPFVITAVIVCGGGSQVLSETVQEWIRSTSQVRNAPKNHLI